MTQDKISDKITLLNPVDKTNIILQ